MRNILVHTNKHSLTLFFCFIVTGMDKTLFFQAWNVYQVHWGMHQQAYAKTRHSARLLQDRMMTSTKMKALAYMHDIIKMMWNMELFVEPDEIFANIQDMSDACLEEEWMENARDLVPYFRLQNNIRLPVWYEYGDVYQRHWDAIGRPKMRSFVENRKQSIYRVSAILVWM